VLEREKTQTGSLLKNTTVWSLINELSSASLSFNPEDREFHLPEAEMDDLERIERRRRILLGLERGRKSPHQKKERSKLKDLKIMEA